MNDKLIDLIQGAKAAAIMGDSVFDYLTELEELVTEEMKESGQLGKMSKSEKFCGITLNEYIEKVKIKHELLIRKNWEWPAFYNGALEGFSILMESNNKK